MPTRRAKTDAVHDLLNKEGFRLEKMDDSGGETEALYIKERPGGTSIYVTIPLNRDFITESALERIMETAKIPHDTYSHLLNA